MEILIPVFFVAFIGYFIFAVFTKKGKGTSFGGKILKTVDRKLKFKSGVANSTLQVHVIEKKKNQETAVAIELNQHAYIAWSRVPINLSKADAKALISMLQEAVKPL